MSQMQQDGITEMPKVNISGEEYKVGGIKQIVASLLGYAKMIAFGLLFADDIIFKTIFGENQPPAVRNFREWLSENKIQFGLMAFFGLTMV
jgi:hypothetical protein